MGGSLGTRNGRVKGAQLREAEGLQFRTPEELLVYRELCEAQANMPEFDSFSILTNCKVRAPGQTFEVDIVVVHRSSTAVIEVDGSFHERRWSNDRSRDQLLEDGGIAFIHRIDVRDVHNPRELNKFVRRFRAHLDRGARSRLPSTVRQR